jgi:hypothetical protein
MISLIKQWMESFKIPTERDFKTCKLYSKLVQEELRELDAEFSGGKSEAELKEAIDLLWVASARVIALGYSFEEINKAFAQVFYSNMSKRSSSKEALENYIKENMLAGYTVEEIEGYFVLLNNIGKIQKGPFYHEPKIKLDE